MDVHVHPVGSDPEEQVHFRASLLDRRDAVGFDDGVRDRPVLHDAAIDEHVLGAADRPLIAEPRHVAFDRQAASFLAHIHEIGTVAEELKKPLGQRRRPADTAAACGRRWSA